MSPICTSSCLPLSLSVFAVPPPASISLAVLHGAPELISSCCRSTWDPQSEEVVVGGSVWGGGGVLVQQKAGGAFFFWVEWEDTA